MASRPEKRHLMFRLAAVMGTELTKADTSVEWLESLMEEYAARGEKEGNSKTKASFWAQQGGELRSGRDNKSLVPLHLRGQMRYSREEVAATRRDGQVETGGGGDDGKGQLSVGPAPSTGSEKVGCLKTTCGRCKVIIKKVAGRTMCRRCVEEEAVGRGWRDPATKFPAGRLTLEKESGWKGWKEVVGQDSKEWATKEERAWTVAGKQPGVVRPSRARSDRREGRKKHRKPSGRGRNVDVAHHRRNERAATSGGNDGGSCAVVGSRLYAGVARAGRNSEEGERASGRVTNAVASP